MLHENLLTTLLLLFAVSMMTMPGQELKISYPIFLVLARLLIIFQRLEKIIMMKKFWKKRENQMDQDESWIIIICTET